MRILFASPYVPSPVRVRPYNWLRVLAALGHSVHLVALRPPEDEWAPVDPLREFCVEIDVYPLSRRQTLWNAAKALGGSLPLQAAYSRHRDAERRVESLAEPSRFDVVHVEHLRGAVLASRVRSIPRVLDAVDSITHLFEQTARSAPSLQHRLMARLDLARTRRFEARAPFEWQRTLVTSPADAEALRRLASRPTEDRVVVLPNGVDLGYFSSARGKPDLSTVLFTGKMSYHANAAAALHLTRQIMPLVWAQRPETKLVLAGKDPSPDIRALAADSRVTVTGFVDDLRPWFAAATVAVSPLVYGAGIQNKVLEAMACGVPVVASKAACGGLVTTAGEALRVGEDPATLARHILDVLSSPPLGEQLGRAGRRYVERHHDWFAVGQRLVEVYESACHVDDRPRSGSGVSRPTPPSRKAPTPVAGAVRG